MISRFLLIKFWELWIFLFIFANERNVKSLPQNMKVQYKSEPLSIPSENRHLLFRKDPSELSLWDRLFNNRWKYVYCSLNYCLPSWKTVDDCLNTVFNLDNAHRIIKKCDTYEKLVAFLNAEASKAQNLFDLSRMQHVKWDV